MTGMTKISKDYFKKASSWADDIYGAVELSRNRYQLAFVLAMSVNIVAIITICVLTNMKTLIPLLVHHYENGVTTVEPLTNQNSPTNKAEIESDIVKYVINRESYDVSSYRAQFDIVTLLSSDKVATEYAREQDKNSKHSPIRVLGSTHMREAHIYSVNFIDNIELNKSDLPKNHQNLAEVVFTLSDIDKASGIKTLKHYNALISWDFVTPSENPHTRWLNWDGFRVTRFTKQPRNITKEHE